MKYEIVGKLVLDYGYDVQQNVPLGGITVSCGFYALDVTNELLDTAKSVDLVVGGIHGHFAEKMFAAVRKVSK